MRVDGSQIQNAIYISGESRWPVGAGAWEELAQEVLDPGPFGYIAGGAGNENTMRANLDAFERRRLKPRMLSGNAERDTSVEVLGTPFAGAVLPRADRRPLDRTSRRRGGGRARRGVDAHPVRAVERRVAFDRGDRGGDGRCAAVVPALLGERPRHLRELRAARGGRGLRRDRRHARHADARLAPARPAQRVPPVPAGRGLRAVLHRSGVLREARQGCPRRTRSARRR